jgi:hypothetical protein
MMQHRYRETLDMSVVPIAPVLEAGMKREGAAPTEVKVSNATKGGNSKDSDGIGMWPTRTILPTQWRHVLRVLVVFLALFVSACTGPGHSGLTPSAHSLEGELAGPMIQGDGDGGNGM